MIVVDTHPMSACACYYEAGSSKANPAKTPASSTLRMAPRDHEREAAAGLL
jgi:hypothetical protein